MTKKNWQERFEEKMKHPLHRDISPFTKSALKLFIRQLLSEQKELHVEIVEETLRGNFSSLHHQVCNRDMTIGEIVDATKAAIKQSPL